MEVVVAVNCIFNLIKPQRRWKIRFDAGSLIPWPSLSYGFRFPQGKTPTPTPPASPRHHHCFRSCLSFDPAKWCGIERLNWKQWSNANSLNWTFACILIKGQHKQVQTHTQGNWYKRTHTHTVSGKQFYPQSDSNNSQSSIILLIAEKRSKKTEKIVLALKETAAELNVKKTKKKTNGGRLLGFCIYLMPRRISVNSRTGKH